MGDCKVGIAVAQRVSRCPLPRVGASQESPS